MTAVFLPAIEYKLNSVAYVVHEISVNDLLGCGCRNPVHQCEWCFEGYERHRQVGYLYGDLARQVGCGLFNGHLVFAGGVDGAGNLSREVYTFNIFWHPIDEQNIIQGIIPNLQCGKWNPILMEVNDNLYALGGFPYHGVLIDGFPDNEMVRAFEQYDHQTGQWHVLPHPPILHPDLFSLPITYGSHGRSIYVATPLSEHMSLFSTATSLWFPHHDPFRYSGPAWDGNLYIPHRPTMSIRTAPYRVIRFCYDCPVLEAFFHQFGDQLNTAVINLADFTPPAFLEPNLPFGFARLSQNIGCLVIGHFFAGFEIMEVAVIKFSWEDWEFRYIGTRIFDYSTRTNPKNPTLRVDLLGAYSDHPN